MKEKINLPAGFLGLSKCFPTCQKSSHKLTSCPIRWWKLSTEHPEVMTFWDPLQELPVPKSSIPHQELTAHVSARAARYEIVWVWGEGRRSNALLVTLEMSDVNEMFRGQTEKMNKRISWTDRRGNDIKSVTIFRSFRGKCTRITSWLQGLGLLPHIFFNRAGGTLTSHIL